MRPNVFCTRTVPSSRITQTPMRPSLPTRLNAIRRPFGAKVGANSSRRVSVRATAFPPSASITQTLPFLEKVMRPPSGAQSGRSSIFGPEVSRVGLPPSASITQMSSGAARLLVNAIDAPSGDHSGNASNPTVDVSRVWFEPSASITQMSWNESRALDVYAIAEPSGDQVGQVSCTTGVDVVA